MANVTNERVYEVLSTNEAEFNQAVETLYRRGASYRIPGVGAAVNRQRARQYLNDILAQPQPDEQLTADQRTVCQSYRQHYNGRATQRERKGFAGLAAILAAVALAGGIYLSSSKPSGDPLSRPQQQMRKQQHEDALRRYQDTHHGETPYWAQDKNGQVGDLEKRVEKKTEEERHDGGLLFAWLGTLMAAALAVGTGAYLIKNRNNP